MRYLAHSPILLALLSGAVLPAGAPAAELTVQVDPAASRITFTLGATLHKVEGTAPVPAAVLRLDPDTGEMRGMVKVDATALTTHNRRRDRKMHQDVLESDAHPAIILRPRRLRGSFDPRSGGTVNIEAEMEIHGDRHDLRVPLRIQVQGSRATATGSFTVPYADWGMEDPSAFVLRVAKEVLVRVEIQADLAPAPIQAPGSP